MGLYQAVIQDDLLYMTAYFRSNAVYNVYPRNIYGILKIQDELCKRLNLGKGCVNTIACSAHVYERNFEDLKVFAESNILFCDEDERGYFFIEVNEKGIQVTLYSKEGVEQKKFQGISATELRDVVCFHTGNKEHAFYLGQELAKARLLIRIIFHIFKIKD